ncbi:hypothetical protein, partial [Larkinella ripae]
AALLHDVIEDTEHKYDDLYRFLKSLKIPEALIGEILIRVVGLTDWFTKEAYPHWNRKKRKAAEHERMSGLPELTQTIKYADIIDNTASIVEHDPGFAKVYLVEVHELLLLMNKGDKILYETALAYVEKQIKRQSQPCES